MIKGLLNAFCSVMKIVSMSEEIDWDRGSNFDEDYFVNALLHRKYICGLNYPWIWKLAN